MNAVQTGCQWLHSLAFLIDTSIINQTMDGPVIPDEVLLQTDEILRRGLDLVSQAAKLILPDHKLPARFSRMPHGDELAD